MGFGLIFQVEGSGFRVSGFGDWENQYAMRPAKSQVLRSLRSPEKSIDVTVVLLCALGFRVWGLGLRV